MLVNRIHGRLEEVVEAGMRSLGPSIDAIGLGDSIRTSWPEVVAAAIALGRFEEADRALALVGDRPRGHIPPFFRAQLGRLQALLAAAEGRNDVVEEPLSASIEMFAGLGYPYWLAVTQTDLAGWLIDRGRGSEAAPLLEDAISALTPLRAAPALDRATALADTLRARAGELAR